MKDGGRSSGDGLQDQFSNYQTLRGDKIPGGERSGKRRSKLRHVWIRKTNESELLMRRRKEFEVNETKAQTQPWDATQKGPAYGLGVDRRTSSVSLILAFMWNMGTWHPDAKGDIQGEATPRVRVPKRDAGADQLVVVVMPGNAGGAKGLDRSASGVGQPVRGGIYV